MSWSIGFDYRWNRDVGYGVPAWCDYPGCYEKIDRGLAYVCCGQEIKGGSEGCGLYFCAAHHAYKGEKCERCHRGLRPFTPSADTDEWIEHKMTDESWSEWRKENL